MCAADARSAASLSGAEWLTWPETRAVFAALAGEGVETRAVGGAVRDTLAGRPVTEIDLATTAGPREVMEMARRAGLKAVPTGLDHGTVTVVSGDRPFEVTTLRRDVETYGRRARVVFTDDWAADARRRDFTVNALYMSADGTLHDPLGGLADLRRRRVRFICEARERIREDFLRILRFFRFSAEFGSAPYDADGLAACVAERAGLAGLSAERVRHELLRLLAAEGAGDAIAAMFDHGLLVDVLARVPYLARFRRLTRLEAALGLRPDPVLRLAALAVAVPEDAEGLRAGLRLSNAEHGRMVAAAEVRALPTPQDEAAARAALYRAGARTYRDRVLLAWAHSGAGDGGWRALYDLPERWRAPEFPLKGQDIVALGVAKGPRVGEVLRAVEEAWIAGGFQPDRGALLATARAMAARKV